MLKECSDKRNFLSIIIVTNGLAVDKDNVIEAWKLSYNVDAPQELVDAAK